MKIDKFISLITIAGKGILGGFGFGAVAFGLFFLNVTFNNNAELNIGAFVAILSGIICIFMSFYIKAKPTGELQI